MRRSLELAHEDPGYAQSQTRELRRVEVKIEDVVADFCRHVWTTEADLFTLHLFTGNQLEQYAIREASKQGLLITAGSAMRILRELRKRRIIDYVVADRSRSMYRLTSFTPNP